MVEKRQGIKFDNKLLAVVFITVACVIVTFYVELVLRIPIVYIHLFYIPIILAGVWYHKKAIYVAFGLGMTHILIMRLANLTLSINEVGWMVTFLVVAYVIGVVSEKEAEEGRALQESHDKLSKIVDGSSIPAFVLDAEHKVTHWNSALEALTGVKREEVLGTDNQWKAFYPAKRSVMADLVISGASDEEFTEKYGDKYRESTLIDGAYETLDFFPALGEDGKWLLFTAAPLMDSKGNIVGVKETLQDFTKLKRAEDALERSENKLQTILDSVPISIFYMDSESRFVAVNEILAKRYGWKPEDFRGKTSRALFPEKAEAYIKSDREVLESGEPQIGKIEKIKTPEGVRWVRLDKVPIKDADGNITGIIGFELDITELIKTQEALRASENRYRTIFEATRSPTAILEEDATLYLVNEEFAKLAGFTKEELEGKKSWTEFVVKEDLERMKKYHYGRRADPNTAPKNYEFRFLDRYGNVRNIYLTVAVIPETKRTVASFMDLTEHKQAEKRQLQLIKELESANKELKDFAHVVSHDLKAPLRGIASLAEWLSTDYADKLDEEGKEQLDLMMNRMKRMHQLIDGILHYSRVGRMEEEEEEVDLNILVSEVIDLIDPPDSIKIEVVNQLPTIYCEKTQMGQVFQNLVSNAVKYMDKPKGEITIGCTEEDGYWKLSVTDNGPGIDEKHHERIFQIFQTLQSRDDLESTGIGLSIVKKIVELNGGKIWVESKEGEGSTFFFTVPKVTPVL